MKNKAKHGKVEHKGNGQDHEAHQAEHDVSPQVEASEASPESAAEQVEPQVSAEPQVLVEEPAQKIARLESEKAELQDRLLRAAAEFENYKKRSKRESDEAAPRAREGLLREILPVIDNFERAIAAAERGGTLTSFVDGVKMLAKQLDAALEKFGVKRFESLGQPFDPARHEALMQLETKDQAPGTVAQVFAQGYLVGERILRAAMVAVAKAPAEAPPPDPPVAGDA